MRARYFTPAEATALIPRLESELGEIRLELEELRELLSQVMQQSEQSPDRECHKDPQLEVRMTRLRLRLEIQVEDLLRLGLLVQDVEAGVVDFPALREGRPVLLSWAPGESCVAHWHELSTRFETRKPIEPDSESQWIWLS